MATRSGAFGSYSAPVSNDETREEKAKAEAFKLLAKARAAIEARRDHALESCIFIQAKILVRVRASLRAEASTQLTIADELYETTWREIVADGEFSEETSARWDFLFDPIHAASLHSQPQMLAGDADRVPGAKEYA